LFILNGVKNKLVYFEWSEKQTCLFRFFMGGMLLTAGAVLLELKLALNSFFVFVEPIVDALTILTS